jgi:multicomponent Na+:H+ antiporter subunit B
VKGFLVLRIIAKLLIPYILLFALYVQFHGDFGPGGGFQAGVIAAAAIMLYGLIFGLPSARRLVIFWVEAGVAITVSGVMLKIFYMFAGRRRKEGAR